MPSKSHSKPKNKSKRSGFQIVGFVLLFLFLVCVGMAVGILAGYLKNAPSVEDVEVRPSLPTVVYDANGKVLTKLMIENRVWVPLSQMSPDLINAVLAVEDHTFYQHHGISVRRILGALWQDIKHLSPDQGGSTITAQLAKNVFLSREKTINRKIWEALYAFQLERRYTKDEILEFYLNWVWFGHGRYGVEAAAQLYYGKHANELTLGEAALLAGIPKGAEIYSPYKNPDLALSRRRIVLQRMVDVGCISPEEARKAAEEPLKLVGLKDKEEVGKYAKYMVRDYLLKKYGSKQVYSGGLTVKTTIDLNAQRAAERAVSSLLPKGRVEKRDDGTEITYPQVALIAINAQTGKIRAIVGGTGEDEFNRAMNAVRSPGSCIKPFVYATAVKNGYTPSTIVMDEPYVEHRPDGSVWAPKNYNGKFQGPMTMRHALEQSTNMVAIQLLRDVGPLEVIRTAKSMGISTLVDSGARNDSTLALALGGLTRGVKPVEMVKAYSALANAGVKVEPYYIEEVRDKNGVVLENNRPEYDFVLDDKVAYIMTDMMKGVISSGTGRRANIGRPAAGKTGTADSNTDAWFVGYTPDMVAAVWIGEDTLKEMSYPGIGKIGSSKAAEIWGSFMKTAVSSTPVRDFPKPEGIVEGVRICESSGKLATASCPASKVVSEVFISGTEPTTYCNVHSQGRIVTPSVPSPPVTNETSPQSPEAEGQSSYSGSQTWSGQATPDQTGSDQQSIYSTDSTIHPIPESSTP